MKFNFIFFLLLTLSFKAQQKDDKLLFDKCKREFSKKVCKSDNDNDKILYYLDNCPQEFGVLENNGCPFPDTDTDGDGVLDKDDACVDAAGPSENKGCPWSDTDGDGILDKDDEYPLVPSNCEIIYAERKKRAEDFKKNYVDIPFENSLIKKIIDRINNKEILTESVVVVLYAEGYKANDVGPCPQFFSNNQSLFLYVKTWTLESISYLQKKINKNIFFIIAGSSFSSLSGGIDGYNYFYLTEKLFQSEVNEDKDFANFDFIRQFPKITLDDGSIVYYFPKNNFEKLSTIKKEDISLLGIYGNAYTIIDKKNKSYLDKNYEIKDGELFLKFCEWRKNNEIVTRFPYGKCK